MSIENNDYFVEKEEAKRQLADVMDGPDSEDFFEKCLGLLFFLSVRCPKDMRGEKKEYIFKNDLEICRNFIELNKEISLKELMKFDYNGRAYRIKISEGTVLYISDSAMNKQVPAFVRSLFYHSSNPRWQRDRETDLRHYKLMNISVVTCESNICEYMEQASKRRESLERIRHSNFANSASYMGSKKKIAGFIVESMFPYLSGRPAFIDLMCGSGSMSHAFAQIGETFASDAQSFCRLLAKIQGGGFTKKKADRILSQIDGAYQEHFSYLVKSLNSSVEEEDYIFHMDLSNPEEVLQKYDDYVERFEVYSSEQPSSEEMAVRIVERKKSNTVYPYCLFTFYYANIYFGLQQCIQLDSLRYAIDLIDDKEERDWALGILVVSTYQIASGHAGHFAQPKKVTAGNIENIFQMRQRSAYLEFCKRFQCIAEESSFCPNQVQTIPGPWLTAIQYIKDSVTGEKAIYLDAPYKRDEYSRYYHILETIVKYDYPSSEGNGRVRSKKKGERFSTEFFTKTVSSIECIFINLINEILNIGAICAWSYSDNGMASIVNVISGVMEKAECEVYLYGTHYKHASQRKIGEENKRQIPVIEYVIIFKKNE